MTVNPSTYQHSGISHALFLRLCEQIKATSRTQNKLFFIGITGSVAAGKSQFAHALGQALAHELKHERTQESVQPRAPIHVLSTDHFLYPNAVLAARGLSQKKGFPESYDGALLYHTLEQLKHENKPVTIPVYSHTHYDREPRAQTLAVPQVLVIEGLNVLQQQLPGASPGCVSDFLDLSLYLDANETDLRSWYIVRFQHQCAAYARGENQSPYWAQYGHLNPDAQQAKAGLLWDTINGPNLREHIAPTRSRAQMVLYKNAEHRVCSLVLQPINPVAT